MLLELKPQLQKRLNVDSQEIVEFCQHWNITELALFGSVLTDQFQSNSDIDVLIRFAPDTPQGLLTLARIKYQLESLFGREVDVVVKEAIEHSENWIRRHEILKTATVIYEKR
ncbi:MAG: nucleotidyltransferase domain-containing protein [Microcoleaceae cyanobacterium]